MSVKTPYYTFVALFFFYTGFFTLFVLYIHTTDSLFSSILSSFSIYSLSFVFNMFGVLKSPKRRTAIFPSRISKRDCSVPQPIFILHVPRIRRPLLLPLSPLSQPWH